MLLFIIVILLYPVIVGSTLCVLNDKCLLPGTSNYKYRQLERRTELETEQNRAALVQARYRARENELLDAIQNAPKQITAGENEQLVNTISTTINTTKIK